MRKKPLYAELLAVADCEHARWARDYRGAVHRLQRAISLELLADALSTNNLIEVEKQIPWDLFAADLRSLWRLALLRVVVKASDVTDRSADVDDISKALRIKRDLRAAADWAEQHAAELVTNVTDQNRQTLRGIVATRLETRDFTPKRLAARIKQEIGLLPRHALAVARLRGRTIAQLRKAHPDMRGAAILARANAIADAYAAKLLDYRAVTIARTETVNALTRGQLETWYQAAREKKLDLNRAWIRWIVTPDDRLCPICAKMTGARAVVPLGAMFDTPVGMLPGPTLHPRCRCSLELVRSYRPNAV